MGCTPSTNNRKVVGVNFSNLKNSNCDESVEFYLTESNLNKLKKDKLNTLFTDKKGSILTGSAKDNIDLVTQLKNKKDNIKGKEKSLKFFKMSNVSQDSLYNSKSFKLNDSIPSNPKLEFKSKLINEINDSPYNNYNELNLISEGKYGNIYKVEHKETKIIRVMKVINIKNKLSINEQNKIINEFNILKAIDHANIVKVFELYNYNNIYYIITEYIDGITLVKKLDSIKIFSEKECSFIVFQILSAIQFCHLKKIIHNNINLDNIILIENVYKNTNTSKERKSIVSTNDFNSVLMNSNLDQPSNYDKYIVKIINFSNSRYFYEDEIIDPKQLYNNKIDKLFSIDVPYFLPSEVINLGYSNFKVDIYAIGIITYIMLVGDLPFYNEDSVKLIDIINNGDFKQDNRFEKLSLSAKNFIINTLKNDIELRYNAEQALNSSFINFVKDNNQIKIGTNKLKEIAERISKSNANSKLLVKVCLEYIVHNLLKPTEIEKFRKMFNYLNTAHDGRLTKKQLMLGFKNMYSPEDIEILISNSFNNIDNDANGYIEFEEFICAILDKNKFFTKNNIKHVFNAFIGNNTSNPNYIKASDFKKFILEKDEVNCKLEDELINNLVKEIDENYDGEISFSEFYNMIKNLSNRVD